LKREKVKTVGEVVLLAVIFCSYFIAGYFFSVNSFAQTPAILIDLDTIYFQDITLDSLMAFVREDYFFNYSIPSEDLHTMSGTEVFLERSSHRAMSYLELRKSIPAVFGDISDYIQALETSQLCNLTFQD
jgi:cytochrome bd-type quinol oxidase subunit 1